MRFATCLFLVLLGCSSPDDGDVARTTTAKMPFEFVPHLSPGRWRQMVTMTETRRPPLRQTEEHRTRVECVSSVVDPQRLALIPDALCVSPGFRHTAGGLIYEANCSGGRIRTIITGNLNTSYVADRTMIYGDKSGTWSVHLQATHEGACRGDE